jgi:hypothetical protein
MVKCGVNARTLGTVTSRATDESALRKNWLGGWEMTVLDGGRSVTVKRVK